jgi:hypothetical protein
MIPFASVAVLTLTPSPSPVEGEGNIVRALGAKLGREAA